MTPEQATCGNCLETPPVEEGRSTLQQVPGGREGAQLLCLWQKEQKGDREDI